MGEIFSDFQTDRAKSVYLDHVARLENVAQEMLVNGSLSDRMGDGLVSQRGAGPAGQLPGEKSSFRKYVPEGRAVKRRRLSPTPEVSFKGFTFLCVCVCVCVCGGRFMLFTHTLVCTRTVTHICT